MRQKTKRDWSAYNKSLVKRGDLFLWFDEETLSNWYSAPDCNKQGRPYTYSDVAIQTLLSIREVFHLTYRSLEGFGQSLFAMLGITELTAPDYTSVCKRAKTLNVPIKVYDHRQTLHLLIDSTGLKVFGEGEWKVKKHGVSKRRTWRKIHIAVDGNTYQIHAVETTKTNVDDAEGALKLFGKSASVSALCEETARTIKRRFIRNSPVAKARLASRLAVTQDSIAAERLV